MTAQFQSSITEWVGLPLSKVENLKVGNEFVGYLEDHDEFHLGHAVFETVMGHSWENVSIKWTWCSG